MIALMKPKFFTDEAKLVDVDLRKLIEHPLVRPNKEDTPLWCFCTLEDNVTLKKSSIYAASINVKEYTAIQLDYDSGFSMDDFIRTYSDKFMFAAYTSFSYGYKGTFDRYRIIIPLKNPMPQSIMCHSYMDVMMEEFPGCDGSAFGRCHFQACPVIRAEGAPYRFHFNRVNKYYEPPYEKIARRAEETLNEIAYDCAVEEWRLEYGSGDEEQNFDGVIRWAQERLDSMVEGNRNTTMFSVLSFCRRTGTPFEKVSDLYVPADCENEWSRMLSRIYR